VRLTNGDILDYAYARANISYSFQIGVPRAAIHGYEVQAEQLMNTSQQVNTLIQKMANVVLDNKLSSKVEQVANMGFLNVCCIILLFGVK
jgi:hypothetical protein